MEKIIIKNNGSISPEVGSSRKPTFQEYLKLSSRFAHWYPEERPGPLRRAVERAGKTKTSETIGKSKKLSLLFGRFKNFQTKL